MYYKVFQYMQSVGSYEWALEVEYDVVQLFLTDTSAVILTELNVKT